MGRPSRIEEQRRSLIPIVARAFAEMGFRRATTALIARRCRVRENILYRLWRDKKDMFRAAIRHVHDLSVETWAKSGTRSGGFSFLAAMKYEADHIGEFGNYRVLFAALTETDDPEIRQELARFYGKMHAFLTDRIRSHRRKPGRRAAQEAALVAWGLMGLGTLSTILRELDLAPRTTRKRLLFDLGKQILEG